MELVIIGLTGLVLLITSGIRVVIQQATAHHQRRNNQGGYTK